ncbi:MFS transporter [Actinopolymorpha pittospori]|uniref:MFS family permease n=1 Tax=Actinopolymorpha pittospori TaxID=648752 RepID=A0A927R844_9ACTN|nr:MFS transporter [Actinopolymorpha pittospori]MBE1606287.1 MFS family permease [Actinopolymorpha pittospori]
MPREVSVLASIAFAVAVGFGVVAPALPVFARDFGVGHTAAAAVISAFALMRFVAAPVSGRLVDKMGERAVMLTGIFFVAGSTAISGLSQTYLQLLLLRSVGGIGSAMFTVSAVSLLLRVVDADRRGQANGLFQGGFLVGGLMGPVVGGLLTEITPRLPFFVYGGALAVAGVIGAMFLAKATLHERLSAQNVDGERTTLREALHNRAYQAALVTNFGTGWAVFGVRSSLVPLFVVEGLKVGAIWTGIGFLVGSIVQATLLISAGKFADTVGRRPAMILGGVLAIAASLVVTFSSTLPTFLIAMGLFGAGSAYLGVAPGAVIGDVVRGRGGQVVAVFQMSADLGSILGPLAAGMMADSMSFGAAFGATAGILIFGPLLALRMPETRYTRQPVVEGAPAAGAATAPAAPPVGDPGRNDGAPTVGSVVVPEVVISKSSVGVPETALPNGSTGLPQAVVQNRVVQNGAVRNGVVSNNAAQNGSGATPYPVADARESTAARGPSTAE